MARGKVLKNPSHWYFPISYREMHKRRMRNIDRALRKIGLTRAELKKEREKREKKNGRRNSRKKRRKGRKRRVGKNGEMAK